MKDQKQIRAKEAAIVSDGTARESDCGSGRQQKKSKASRRARAGRRGNNGLPRASSSDKVLSVFSEQDPHVSPQITLCISVVRPPHLLKLPLMQGTSGLPDEPGVLNTAQRHARYSSFLSFASFRPPSNRGSLRLRGGIVFLNPSRNARIGPGGARIRRDHVSC